MAAGISDMITFIGAVLAAGLLAGVIVDQGGAMARAMDGRAESQAASLETSITILNDAATLQDEPLQIHVLNSGQRPIALDALVMLIDGAPVEPSRSVFDHPGSLVVAPGQIASLVVAGPQPVGDRIIEILGPAGSRDTVVYYEVGP